MIKLACCLAAFMLMYSTSGYCAAPHVQGHPARAFYLTEKLQGPIAPTKPAAPIKPSLDGKQERPAPPPPLPEIPRQNTVPEKFSPAKENVAPPKEKIPVNQPEIENKKEERINDAPENKETKVPAANNLGDNDKKTLPAQKGTVEEQDHQRFIQTWIKNTLYFLLIFAACGTILYVSHKHPPKPQNIRAKARPQPNRQPHPAAAPVSPAQEFSPSIKNKSLLEQLVRYDMETYGELRSSLNYDQPAYVELLIRKYGGGDAEKINRAIHLFHKRRNKT